MITNSRFCHHLGNFITLVWYNVIHLDPVRKKDKKVSLKLKLFQHKCSFLLALGKIDTFKVNTKIRISSLTELYQHLMTSCVFFDLNVAIRPYCQTSFLLT